MRNFTTLFVLLVGVLVFSACTKETTPANSVYQSGATGFELPAEVKGAEVQFYRNSAMKDATCEGLFAIVTSDNEQFVLEISNPTGDPLLQQIKLDTETYIVDYEFLQVSYTCYQPQSKSGSPDSQPEEQVAVEKAVINSLSVK
jgi:hypothetical protein